ncbi:MAG: hypothetical protein WD509_03195 [Candidatus Paceibacterota bacterium]
MKVENQNLKTVVVFLIGMFVGSFSLWMWTATQDALSEKVQVTPNTEEIIEEDSTVLESTQGVSSNTPTQERLVRNDAIIVQNQKPGMTVVIDKAVLEEDGWIVIHEGTVSHIGNALGASRFDKGEHSGVVELLRSTERGVIYRAVLYRDNGDKEFSLDSDFPFLQNGNQPVLTTFIVE